MDAVEMFREYSRKNCQDGQRDDYLLISKRIEQYYGVYVFIRDTICDFEGKQRLKTIFDETFPKLLALQEQKDI